MDENEISLDSEKSKGELMIPGKADINLANRRYY